LILGRCDSSVSSSTAAPAAPCAALSSLPTRGWESVRVRALKVLLKAQETRGAGWPGLESSEAPESFNSPLETLSTFNMRTPLIILLIIALITAGLGYALLVSSHEAPPSPQNLHERISTTAPAGPSTSTTQPVSANAAPSAQGLLLYCAANM